MARRKQRTNVSLFAFQDIITSVMGILILVVLLLSVLVTQTVEHQARASESVPSEAAPSNEEISDFRRQVESMQSQLDGSLEMLNEIASLESKEQIQRKIQEQEMRLDTLNRSISSSRSTAVQLQSEVTVEEGKLAAMAESLGVKNLQSYRDQLQDEIELLTSNRRMMFNFRNLSGKTAWIVDVSSKGLQIAEIGVNQAPLVIQHQSPSRIAADFSIWLNNKDPQTTHVVLAVKPNAVNLFDEVKELIDGTATTVGIELLPEDVQIIDPKKGATF